MTEPEQEWAVQLLIAEAWDAIEAGRYAAAAAAAGRAVQAAEHLDDPVLLVRTLEVQAATLGLQGDNAAALTRHTRILGLAEDPATRRRLEHPDAVPVVAGAHMAWVAAARFVGGVPRRALFKVLDAGERYLRAVGRPQWRAGLLSERASIHSELGEWDAAVAAEEEALAVYQPDAPGFTLADHRNRLGDILRGAGRAADAEPHYQAVLDDPDSQPYDRVGALGGLAWCALETEHTAAARRYALAAVRDGEPLGDEALRSALQVLVVAHQAADDLDAAAAAAERYLQVARRVGGHYNLFFALRTAVEVALDRGDAETVRSLLADLDRHAHVLDTDGGTTLYSAEADERRQQFSHLRPEDAIADYSQILEQDEHHVKALHNRALAYWDLQRTDEALADFDHALQIEPHNIDLLLAHGALYLELGRAEDAIADYSQVLEQDQDQVDALGNRALAYWDLQRTDEALADFDHALRINPDDSWARATRGDLLHELGRDDEAITAYNEVLDRDDSSAVDALWKRGWLLWDKNDVDNALADFKRGLAREPGNLQLLDAWCHVHLELGKMIDAVEAADRAMAHNPTDATALRLQANVKAEVGDYAGALGDLEQAVSIAPRDALARQERARIFIELDRPTEAIDELHRLTRVQAAMPGVVDCQIEAYLYAGGFDAAEQIVSTRTESHQDSDWSRFLRGLLSARQGRRETAALDFESSRSIALSRFGPHPVSARAAFNLAHYHLASGEYDRSVAIYQETLLRNPSVRRVHVALHEMRLMEKMRVGFPAGWRLFDAFVAYLDKERTRSTEC